VTILRAFAFILRSKTAGDDFVVMGHKMVHIRKELKEEKLELLGETASFEMTGLPPSFYGQKTFSPHHFIYKAAGEKGDCVNLFKVLQSNFCENNCLYCVNRKDRNCQRVEFEPEELAGLFYNYYRRGWVHGLFLSSGVHHDPNRSQQKMLATIEILRRQYAYRGYIHCKILPGVDEGFIDAIGKVATRLSLNLETANAACMAKLGPGKNYDLELMGGLKRIADFNKKHPVKAGVTTQIIVGGAGETDKDILNVTQKLYDEYKLERVYYSGFIPVDSTPLEHKAPCLPLREARIYQADFLLRRYNFKAEELIFEKDGNIELTLDPKMNWALHNQDRFPLEINTAGLEDLMRVPGIGRISARKIMELRRQAKLADIDKLKKIMPSLRRAHNFITLNGRFYPLKMKPQVKLNRQMSFWDELWVVYGTCRTAGIMIK
jgi:putative DNA modification/repair radical SAM protein